MAASARASRTDDPAVAPSSTNGFVRLASCPQCSGRRRLLREEGGEVRGHCLACGAELSLPLATERHAGMVLLGSGG